MEKEEENSWERVMKENEKGKSLGGSKGVVEPLRW